MPQYGFKRGFCVFFATRPYEIKVSISVFRMFLMSRAPKNPTTGNPSNPYIEDTILLEKQVEHFATSNQVNAHETATRIMLQVHLVGKGVCGIFTRDVAATKVHQVIELSREAGHPLQCTMEEA